MIRDKSVFLSKKHEKYHNMLKNGFDGILSEVNLTEDQILNNVKCHINLAYKNRRKPKFFEIDSIEKLIKFENYKSYDFLLDKNLLVVKPFPMYKKSITIISIWESDPYTEKRSVFKNLSIYDEFIKNKKTDLLPKFMNLYLKNKENKSYLAEFINHYFINYEGDYQESKDLLNLFNDNNYQNVKNKDLVFSYLHRTMTEEKKLLASQSLMFYPNIIMAVNSHNNGQKTTTSHLRSEEEIFTIKDKIK